MSKQDNLTDFLVDVADAIREKKGTTEKINPQNFSEEIRGIESGNVLAEEMIDTIGGGVTNIKHITFGEGVTSIMTNATARSMVESIHLPSTLKRIESSAFHTSPYLSRINTIPKSVEYIGQQAFAYCGKLLSLDFSSHESIPTLGGKAAFSDQTIIVPDNLYGEWIKASNWADYASKIIDKSTWEEQNL